MIFTSYETIVGLRRTSTVSKFLQHVTEVLGKGPDVIAGVHADLRDRLSAPSQALFGGAIIDCPIPVPASLPLVQLPLSTVCSGI